MDDVVCCWVKGLTYSMASLSLVRFGWVGAAMFMLLFFRMRIGWRGSSFSMEQRGVSISTPFRHCPGSRLLFSPSLDLHFTPSTALLGICSF